MDYFHDVNFDSSSKSIFGNPLRDAWLTRMVLPQISLGGAILSIPPCDVLATHIILRKNP